MSSLDFVDTIYIEFSKLRFEKYFISLFKGYLDRS